ncbi:MAG: aromatic amino acid lyase [Elusimicrobia bacterium]|nr:aromatic amino acid lyase [Elusimicrobiota bacterium]
MPAIFIDPTVPFSLEEFSRALQTGSSIRPSAVALSKVRRGFQNLTQVLDDPSRKVYGIHTGFGGLQGDQTPSDSLEDHQRDLVASHACGVGDLLEDREVRAMMYLRARQLSRGYSGISTTAFNAYLNALNSGKLPTVPSQGSVGASGDLIPMAHIALKVLEKIPKGKLGPRDGLSLINGTEASLAVSLLNWERAGALFDSALSTAALSLFAFSGKTEAWDPVFINLKKHREMAEVSGLLMKRLGSYRSRGLPQDPYSFRAAVHVFGGVLKLLRTAQDLLFKEADSVTDNPVILFAPSPHRPIAPSFYHGAHFHGLQVALAADMTAWAMNLLAMGAERRTDWLLSGRRLPMMLPAKARGSGLMMLQTVQGALVAENRLLSRPASADSIPSSANQEDFVPMAMGAALKAKKTAANAGRVVAIEALAAGRAVALGRSGAKTRLPSALAVFLRTIERAAGRALSQEDRDFSAAVERIAVILERAGQTGETFSKKER